MYELDLIIQISVYIPNLSSFNKPYYLIVRKRGLTLFKKRLHFKLSYASCDLMYHIYIRNIFVLLY